MSTKKNETNIVGLAIWAITQPLFVWTGEQYLEPNLLSASTTTGVCLTAFFVMIHWGSTLWFMDLGRVSTAKPRSTATWLTILVTMLVVLPSEHRLAQSIPTATLTFGLLAQSIVRYRGKAS